MSIKSILIAAGIVTANFAYSECYIRSSSITEPKQLIERVADVQNTVVTLSNQQIRCTSTFRALIKGQWHTAEGYAIGSKDTASEQLCAQARNSGSIRLLHSISGTKFTMQEEMVCTDQNIPKTRPVKIGEIIRESEVVPDPAWPNARKFSDGNVCRRFVESNITGPDMNRTRGVICQVNGPEWKVVDKW